MALQVWLPLNGTLENKGLSNVTVTNNGATVDNNGKIGKCYSFNSNKTISSTVNISASPISVSAWVYLTSFHNTWNYVVSLNGSSGYVDTCIGICLESSNKICFVAGGKSSLVYTHTESLIGKWTHLVTTFDGNTIKGYVNGNNVCSLSSTAALTRTNFTIGNRYGGDSTLNLDGKVNDVRLYNHCLSPKEVKEISKGLILHYKLDGNDIGITIPRNGGLIPDGVELYDYILSSGTLYIDTGYVPNNTSGIYLRAYCTTSGGNHLAIGCRQTSGDTRWWINYSSALELSWNLWTGTLTGYTNTWTEIEHNYMNSRSAKVNGTAYSVSYPTLANITYPAYLFNSCNLGNLGTGFIGRLSNAKITEGTTIVRNFIPCTYLGEPGMWDTVENKFYRNKGTGLFTLGNKITLKEYEYLLGDGNSYIDTDVTMRQLVVADYKVRFTNLSSNPQILFGIFGDNTEIGRAQVYILNNQWKDLDIYNLKTTYTPLETISTTIDFTVQSRTKQLGDSGNLFIFARNNDNNNFLPTKMRLYYLTMTFGGVLVRDFIPVSYNGTPGLWDKVEWKFYANAGTGEFTLGPEVTVQQDAPIFYDSSGYCNHGSITGTLTTDSDSPRYTNSIQFGNNKLISTTASGQHILTMSIWAKDAGSIPTNGLMFKDHLGDMALGIQNGILYSGKSGGKGAGSKSISSVGYIANTWHHWVMVNRNNTFYVYMDGQQVLSGTSGTWTAGTITNALHIGGRSGSSPWPGKLSDFRAYATALSEEDILELYNTSAFVTDNGVFAEYELYEDNLSDVKKTGLLETGNFYENGADENHALDTDKTRVASNYIISEEFIEI